MFALHETSDMSGHKGICTLPVEMGTNRGTLAHEYYLAGCRSGDRLDPRSRIPTCQGHGSEPLLPASPLM